MELIKPGTRIPFTSYRKIAGYPLHRGEPVGLDYVVCKRTQLGRRFLGGTVVQVKFQQKVTIPDIRRALESIKLGGSEIQDFGQEGSNEYLIRLEKTSMEVAALGEQVRKALSDQFGADKYEIRRIEFVGPKIGEDLRFRGIMSVVVSTIMMGIYIWFRFSSGSASAPSLR